MTKSVARLSNSCILALVAAGLAAGQQSYPKIQTSIEYANVDFRNSVFTIAPSITVGNVQSTRHSGIGNETTFNFTRTLGITNYLGVYSVAPVPHNSTVRVDKQSTLIYDFFGGTATYRFPHIAVYAIGGVGFGHSSEYTVTWPVGPGLVFFGGEQKYRFGSFTALAARAGAGVQVPINEVISWKLEMSRIGFPTRTGPDIVTISRTNLSTGLIVTLK